MFVFKFPSIENVFPYKSPLMCSDLDTYLHLDFIYPKKKLDKVKVLSSSTYRGE